MAEWSPRVKRIEADQPGRLVYAYALLQEGKFKEAQQEIEAVLRHDEKSFPATVGLGVVLQFQGQFEASVQAFERARELQPMQPIPSLLAGRSYLLLDDLDSAETAFTTVTELDPRVAAAHLGLAQVFNRRKNTEQAIVHAQNALRLDPQLIPARLMLARLYITSGDTSAAMGELEAILAVDPGHLVAAVRLASLYSQRGDTQKADQILSAFLQTKPDTAIAWGAIAQVRSDGGDYEGAEQALRENLRLRPKDVFAQIKLAETLVRLGKLDEARQTLAKLPRRGVLLRPIYACYGDLFLVEGDKDKAIDSYRAAILNSIGGAEIVQGIEAETAAREKGGVPDRDARIRAFRAALDKLRQESKSWFEGEGWQEFVERMRPTLTKLAQRVRLDQFGGKDANKTADMFAELFTEE